MHRQQKETLKANLKTFLVALKGDSIIDFLLEKFFVSINKTREMIEKTIEMFLFYIG